jgi:diguanylate cyclase (GGDEF)-like protein/PAS domain S-box-containing protein
VLVSCGIRAAVQIRRWLTVLGEQPAQSKLLPPDREALLSALADSLPMRVAYVDREGRFAFINRAACERHGLSRAELSGRPASDYVTALRTDRGLSLLSRAYTGVAQRFQHDDIVDGKRLDLETHLTPDFDAEGKVCGLFIIGVDITTLKETERELRDVIDVIESTPDYVAQTDWRGQLQYLNPSARSAIGVDCAAPLPLIAFSEFYTPETNVRFHDEIIPTVRRDGVWSGEARVVLQGGKTVPVSQVVIAHRDPQGRIARYSSLMRNISEQHASRQALARQTAILNAVIESIPAMVAVVDTQMNYVLVNHAFERWHAREREDLVGHSMQDCMESSEFEHSLPFAKRALAGETVSYEVHDPRSSQARHISVTCVPLRLEDGSSGGFIRVAHDITMQREENRRLTLLSERDPLTGLLNRAGFEKYLKIKVQQGVGYACGLLYIDLDYFKPVNDSHGHAVGDEVLREFASRLLGIARPTDAVVRLGGDEFAMVLSGLREAEHAVAVARKVVEIARLPFVIAERVLTLSASVGVAANADAAGGWKNLIRRADAQLYQAKARGRGCLFVEPRGYSSDPPDTDQELLSGDARR